MNEESKRKLAARVKEKLDQIKQLSPKEKAALMAEGVKFSRARNLVKDEEMKRMRTDREFASKVGFRSLGDMLSWEALQELKAEGQIQ